MGCAQFDKEFAIDLAKDKNLDTYVVFDDSEKIEYLNLSGNVIGMETKTVTKTRKHSKSLTKSQKVNKSH